MQGSGRSDARTVFSRGVGCCGLCSRGRRVGGRSRRLDPGTRPNYRVRALWPRPFDNHSWVLGSITGVTVDAQNHVWVVHRGGDSLENNEKGMMTNPPSARASAAWRRRCPGVRSGRQARLQLGRAGPGLSVAAVARRHDRGRQGQRVDRRRRARDRRRHAGAWPRRRRVGEAPAAAPARGRGAPAGPADAHVLKFSRDGKFLLQIGTPGKMDGPTARPR